jgi:hypothetical protein
LKRSRIVSLVISLACIAALSAISSAAAAQVTLGPPLGTTFSEKKFKCTQCTIAQFDLPSPSTAVSPVDGAVVSWSIREALSIPGYALQVLSPAGANATGVATSAPQTPTGNGIETFATNLPIKKGQIIALKTPAGAEFAAKTVPGAREIAFFTPALGDGETRPGSAPAAEIAIALDAQVQPAPTIATISSPGGPATGGTQVTITGTDFEGARAVRFGTVAATSFAVNSESQIIAVAPPGTGSVPVTVTTVAGAATSSQTFTYAAAAAAAPPAAPRCTVPKLRGKTLKSAKKRIRAADCRVGQLTKKKGATAKNGEVVQQVPKPGATVPADTKVKVTLAP